MLDDEKKKKYPKKIDLDILNSSFWQATVFYLLTKFEKPLILTRIKECLEKLSYEQVEDARGNLCINPAERRITSQLLKNTRFILQQEAKDSLIRIHVSNVLHEDLPTRDKIHEIGNLYDNFSIFENLSN